MVWQYVQSTTEILELKFGTTKLEKAFPSSFPHVFSTIIINVEKTLDLFINLEMFEGEHVLILLVFYVKKCF